MRIRVNFSSYDAFLDFREVYGDLVAESAEAEFFVVSDRDETFYWQDRRNALCWTEGEISPKIVSFLADSALMYTVMLSASISSIHAATVADGKSVAAIVGHTTAGKTTTAVACAFAGLRHYSDERCLLSDGVVYPFPRALTLRAGGRIALDVAEPSNAQLADWLGLHGNTEGDVRVRPSELLAGEIGVDPLPLSHVFILDGYGDRPVLRSSTIYAELKTLLSSYLSSADGLDRVARLVREYRKAQVFRLRLGNPHESARLIAATLRETYRASNVSLGRI